MSYIQLAARTDTGRIREHNEDNFIVCPNVGQPNWYLVDQPVAIAPQGCLLVVADGMGGANAGEVASEIAVSSTKDYFSSLSLAVTLTDKQVKNHLIAAIQAAHEAIVTYAGQHPDCRGMGTTIVVAWVFADRAFVAWCGDSRAYLYRAGQGIRMVTKDHSLVWELVEAGELTPQEADFHPHSNIITQSLGDSGQVPDPEVVVVPLQHADRLLLCSDGLNNMLDTPAIEDILRQDQPIGHLTAQLIEAANQRGGKDNITVVVLEKTGEPEPVPAPYRRKRAKLVLLAAGTALMLVVAGWLLTANNSIIHLMKPQPVAAVAPASGNTAVSTPPVQQPMTKIATPPEQKAQSLPATSTLLPRPTTAARPADHASSTEKAALDGHLNRIVQLLQQRDQLMVVRPVVTNEPEPTADTTASGFFDNPERRASERKELINQLNTLLDGHQLAALTQGWQQAVVEADASQQEAIRRRLQKQWPEPALLAAQLDEADRLVTAIQKR